MNSELCEHLREVEVGIVDMLRGIVLFLGHKIPNWIRAMIRQFREVAYGVLRVAFFGGIWLLVVLGPLAAWWKLGMPFGMGVICLSWTALAIIGSFCGYDRMSDDPVIPKWFRWLAKFGAKPTVVLSFAERRRRAQAQEDGAV